MQSEKLIIQPHRDLSPQGTVYCQLVHLLETTATLDFRCGINFYEEIRQYETALIIRSLQLARGSKSKAARLLGLRLTTLHEKMKRYQITYDNG